MRGDGVLHAVDVQPHTGAVIRSGNVNPFTGRRRRAGQRRVSGGCVHQPLVPALLKAQQEILRIAGADLPRHNGVPSALSAAIYPRGCRYRAAYLLQAGTVGYTGVIVDPVEVQGGAAPARGPACAVQQRGMIALS